MKTIGAIVFAIIAFIAVVIWMITEKEDDDRVQVSVYEEQIEKLSAEAELLQQENNTLSESVREYSERIEKLERALCADGMQYGVQWGDTLWDLAERAYDDPWQYPRIAERNEVEDPDYILYAESVICIPDVQRLAVRKVEPVRIAMAEETQVSETEKDVADPAASLSNSADVSSEAEYGAATPAVPETAENTQSGSQIGTKTEIAIGSSQEDSMVDLSLGQGAQLPNMETLVTEDVRVREGLPAATPQPITPSPVEYPSTLPGNMWSTFGNISPAEEDNLISQSRVEQGFTLWRSGSVSLTPYASWGVTFDSEGFDWNNRSVGEFGVKLSKTFGRGVIFGGGGYADEYRFKSKRREGNWFGNAGYWFGWDLPSRENASDTWFSDLPGSTWGTVNTSASPIEGNNTMGMLYGQQGITLARFGRVHVIPFGENTLFVDSKGFDWNNRNILGGGVKLSIPIRTGIFDVGAAYKKEWRWISGRTNDKLVFFTNFWYGWTPSFR